MIFSSPLSTRLTANQSGGKVPVLFSFANEIYNILFLRENLTYVRGTFQEYLGKSSTSRGARVATALALNTGISVLAMYVVIALIGFFADFRIEQLPCMVFSI
jgi:hypothetical protein